MRKSGLWRCENGHILGEVWRNGSRQGQLRLYRFAVQDEQTGVEVSVIPTSGYAEVRCSICGDVKRWYPKTEDSKKPGIK